MTLSEFITAYIPTEFRQGRDFVGPRGWVPLTNLLVQKTRREGLESILVLTDDLTAAADTIPFSADNHAVLMCWLIFQCTSASDKRYMAVRKDFELAWEDAGMNDFTPTEDEARPEPRPLPGLEL